MAAGLTRPVIITQSNDLLRDELPANKIAGRRGLLETGWVVTEEMGRGRGTRRSTPPTAVCIGSDVVTFEQMC